MTAIVPMLGGVVLWAVTGSAYALLFALLGPLIAVASVVDAARGSRRSRRRGAAEVARAVRRAGDEMHRRHADERSARWARHPDVAGFLRRPDAIWRPTPEREGVLVVGRGVGESALRVTGGDGDAGAADLRREAASVSDVPLLVPLTTGVAVVGPPVLAAAVARGLAVQVCLSLAPGRVQWSEDAPSWAAALPHRDAPAGLLLQLRESGGLIGGDVDVPVAVVPEGEPPPPRCGAILRLTGPATAELDVDGDVRELAVEPVSTAQAAAVAAFLADRAARALGRRIDVPVGLDELIAAAPSPAPDALPAVFASTAAEPFVVDLVRDGPHAVVIGVTGSGKSELLTSWVAALCAGHTPQQLALLLVDFKGGRTFDHLLPLPHVTGVLTDLDDATALRAIDSLRAEIRHRERALADVGARDVAETAATGAPLGRLVIVVDEYAALVAAHPALHDLFADLAARGRALGIHLVLAAQRATGVFRDAVLANAPLRLALRVTDAADSRALLGVDDACRLSGRAQARGLALVRRAADSAPIPVRIARCGPGTLAEVASRHPGPPARAPWLPALPARVPLAGVRSGGELVLGLADEPERQWQGPIGWDPADLALAVVGGPGSGRTGILRAIAAQTPTLVVPADPEQAWDVVMALADVPRGTTVAVDDLDSLMTRMPGEYGPAVLDALERALRGARERGIRLVVTAQRLTGGVARLVDLIPRRVVLALPTRADHVAAGGDAADHRPELPPGRGRLGRTLVQFAAAPAAVPAAGAVGPPTWLPGRRPAAVVLPAGARSRRIVGSWRRLGIAVSAVDGAASLVRGGAVVGTAEDWLAQWRLLGAARADADLVVDAACAAEYRAITGSRDLPPFAAPVAGRAWLIAPARPARRVVLAEW
ncbi:FtsK/SpoIIIE domain-containing protein [Microbacterium sp. 179-B 1A2 NHS]|uniref:FtsK/SpoIIIE domain-containing protein n=1 Tax=Microbacterium sp. 179-B 1A2 NHS TaxID=3142383 RepID=UPI0039A13E9A